MLLKIDEIDGDENTKAARKALVRRVNGELDRSHSHKLDEQNGTNFEGFPKIVNYIAS